MHVVVNTNSVGLRKRQNRWMMCFFTCTGRERNATTNGLWGMWIKEHCNQKIYGLECFPATHVDCLWKKNEIIQCRKLCALVSGVFWKNHYSLWPNYASLQSDLTNPFNNFHKIIIIKRMIMTTTVLLKYWKTLQYWPNKWGVKGHVYITRHH